MLTMLYIILDYVCTLANLYNSWIIQVVTSINYSSANSAIQDVSGGPTFQELLILHSEVYLGLCQTSMVEIFSENS